MTDTIIKGTGNSRSIRSVPNLAALAPTYDKLLEYLTGDGLPVDIGPLNENGVDVHGTDLTKASLLKDETAAIAGFDSTAVPDDMFAVLAASLATGKKNLIFNVRDKRGNPMEDVRILGLLTINGNTPTTDETGKCVAVIEKDTEITANSPYLDINDSVMTVSVPKNIVSVIDIVMEDFDTSLVREITESGEYKVKRAHNASTCCIQGGTGGTNGWSGSGNAGGSGGSGGARGAMRNQDMNFIVGTTYTAVVGSGGSNGNPGTLGGHSALNDITSDGGTDTIALRMQDLQGLYCVAGTSGSAGGAGDSSGRGGNGGKGGNGGAGEQGRPGSSGSSTSPFPGGSGGAGGNGGPGSGGGGGGGGGGAGGWGSSYPPVGGGGAGGKGGPGIILIKFLD